MNSIHPLDHTGFSQNINQQLPRGIRPTLLALAIGSALSLSGVSNAGSFTVTQMNDDGSGMIPGTLSWAILQANISLGADTITLNTDVLVTEVPPNKSWVMKRLIDSDVTIQSSGTAKHKISGHLVRPLFIKSGNVTLKNLEFNSGVGRGGASNTGGGGAGMGGAIFLYAGQLSLEDVSFNNNSAVGGPSGVYSKIAGGGGGGLGGRFGASLDYLGGGGGLFASAGGLDGAYGGYGNYGGFPGLGNSYGDGYDGGFAGGGGYGGTVGGQGGFGGGGGYSWGIGGAGGFGGGGAAGYEHGGDGGFGGGAGGTDIDNGVAGVPGWGGGYSTSSEGYRGLGGNGAGLGGAVFVKKGTLGMKNVSFDSNSATTDPGAEAHGGAIFICSGTEGGTNCNGSVTTESCGVSFTNNLATTSSNDWFWSEGNLGYVTDKCTAPIPPCEPPTLVESGPDPFELKCERILASPYHIQYIDSETYGQVTFIASKSVELGMDFKVDQGATFKVRME